LDSSQSDRVLDIGCGSGELTTRLVGSEVIGTDVSHVMVDQARRISNDGRIKYYVVDGLDIVGGLRRAGVDGLFDRVFSNAALHWMKSDPGAVVKGIRQVLKPGGIFAAEYGGYRNLGTCTPAFWSNHNIEIIYLCTVGVRSAVHAALRRRGIDPIAIDPFYFPTPKQYSAILSQNGFHVNHIGLALFLITSLPI
jgi:SAM-dependent methyltransferase